MFIEIYLHNSLYNTKAIHYYINNLQPISPPLFLHCFLDYFITKRGLTNSVIAICEPSFYICRAYRYIISSRIICPAKIRRNMVSG
jgi:hypothetical protein